MSISPSQRANEELNAYFNFLRPDSVKRVRTPLQLTTSDQLGISFTNHTDNNNNDDIFKQLNFPHMKRPHSPSSEASSSSSSPQLKLIVAPPVVVELSPAASFLASFMSPPSNVTQLPDTDDEAVKVVDEYDVGDYIGFGGFSIVCKAKHQKTNGVVAVKIIDQHLMTDTDKLRLERELSIWKSLHHPRIIQLRKVIKTEKTCYLLCDYCSEGNLLTYLNVVKKLTEKEARQIFKEICQGVYYLHIDHKVLHKDLKLENVLLDDQGHIKICDFGLAIYQNKHQSRMYHEEVAGGSLAYASPEQIKQVTPSTCPKTDIWSLGVILYALVTGSLPFMDTYDVRLQQKILEGHFDIPDDLSEPLQQLICDCLAYDPATRVSIDQVLNSVWLKNL